MCAAARDVFKGRDSTSLLVKYYGGLSLSCSVSSVASNLLGLSEDGSDTEIIEPYRFEPKDSDLTEKRDHFAVKLILCYEQLKLGV